MVYIINYKIVRGAPILIENKIINIIVSITYDMNFAQIKLYALKC